jgi:NAD(P)-dependent dehydrogenase (short-subunit alcohol dehydrogenase family)
MRNLKSLFDLTGKFAIVSGGAGYLGRAICETLAEQGCGVAILSRDVEKCIAFATELSQSYSTTNVGVKCDITNIDSIKIALGEVMKVFPGIDILINNAWSGKKNSLESIEYSDWQFDINVCLNGVFYLSKEASVHLKKRSGVILNISSMYGHVAPDYRLYDGDKYTNPPSYGAAKAGVIQLTKYLSSFLAEHNIRVNSISPGPFPFPNTQKENPEFIRRLAQKTILNRIGEPDDLKGAVALLASDASKYMTGQNICVDGGWTVW